MAGVMTQVWRGRSCNAAAASSRSKMAPRASARRRRRRATQFRRDRPPAASPRHARRMAARKSASRFFFDAAILSFILPTASRFDAASAAHAEKHRAVRRMPRSIEMPKTMRSSRSCRSTSLRTMSSSGAAAKSRSLRKAFLHRFHRRRAARPRARLVTRSAARASTICRGSASWPWWRCSCCIVASMRCRESPTDAEPRRRS
mmetsp:Transcript_2876/g.10342  ORF Transcript_2876/g.10342 Transcript_2876/m.10342 type:complete len:203 (+) Transcript_2876:201-809(+)